MPAPIIYYETMRLAFLLGKTTVTKRPQEPFWNQPVFPAKPLLISGLSFIYGTNWFQLVSGLELPKWHPNAAFLLKNGVTILQLFQGAIEGGSADAILGFGLVQPIAKSQST